MTRSMPQRIATQHARRSSATHQIVVQNATRRRQMMPPALRKRRRVKTEEPEVVRTVEVVETSYRAHDGLEFETLEMREDGQLTDFDLHRSGESPS